MIKIALPNGKFVTALGLGALTGGSVWAYGKQRKRKKKIRELAKTITPHYKHEKRLELEKKHPGVRAYSSKEELKKELELNKILSSSGLSYRVRAY